MRECKLSISASLHPVNKAVFGCENVFWTLSHLGIGRSLDFAIRRGKVRVGPAGSDKMRKFPTDSGLHLRQSYLNPQGWHRHEKSQVL